MPIFHKILNIFKNLRFCKPFNGIQRSPTDMNQFGQFEVGQVARPLNSLLIGDRLRKTDYARLITSW